MDGQTEKQTPERKEKRFKFDFNTVKKRLPAVSLLSAGAPLILFVAIPFEVYANNMDEFMFSLSSFLPLCVAFGFLLAAAVAGALLFLPEKVYRTAYAVALALTFLFFLQGTFLNFGMHSLAGDNLGSATPNLALKILDAFIWIAVIAAAVALSLIKDKKGIIAIVAVILCIVVVATQIINPVANTLKHTDVFKSRSARLAGDGENYKNEVLTTKNLTAVSGGRNVFYFCIDRFDECFAETAQEINPDIYAGLKGFTWFKDNLSLYGHTFPSIAYMLTEKEFDMDGGGRKSFLDGVYADNDTLSVLDANGYKINIYTQAYYAYSDAYTLPDYVDNVDAAKSFKTARPLRLAGCMAGTAAYRCLPLFLKDVIYGVESRKFNECVRSVGENGCAGYLSANDTVYKQAASATFEKSGDKSFYFIHVEGCHDVSADYISRSPSSKTKKKIAASVQNGIKIVDEYIRAMRENGVYENATVIITGDHPDSIDDKHAPKGAKRTALFFKPAGESGELKESNAPVAHENIWSAIFQSEGIERDGGKEKIGLFDIGENDETHERRYIWQTYSSKRCDCYTYKITGSAKKFGNWKLEDTKRYDRFLMD